jgi:hypothetical protein
MYYSRAPEVLLAIMYHIVADSSFPSSCSVHLGFLLFLLGIIEETVYNCKSFISVNVTCDYYFFDAGYEVRMPSLV